MKNDSAIKPADIAYYMLILAMIVFYVLINSRLELSFPTPWPDEAHFLWQAHSFSTTNSLFSSVLNEERTIMWMPPGYMFLTGLYFKVVGTSLEAARFLSLMACVIFFVFLIQFLTYYGHRWLTLVLTSLFVLNARFLACGNIARMEGLLLMAIGGAFLLIQRGRFVYGLVILVLAPILHFNGFYFLVAGLMFVWYKKSAGSLRDQLNTRSVILILGVLGAWAAYALLIAANWEGLIHDMAYQFKRKGARSFWDVITGGQYLLDIAIILLAWGYARRTRIRAVELLFLALPAWIIWPIGHELWYEVVQHVGYLVISVLALHVWFHLLPTVGFIRDKMLRSAISVVFFTILLAWNSLGERIENMFRYPDKAGMVSMKMSHDVSYLTEDDRVLLSEKLAILARDHDGICVEFQPHADAFAFVDIELEGVQFTCPLFQEQEPDVIIVHLSQHLPTWWGFGDEALARTGLTRDSIDHIWYERDETEQWFLASVSGRVSTAKPVNR